MRKLRLKELMTLVDSYTRDGWSDSDIMNTLRLSKDRLSYIRQLITEEEVMKLIRRKEDSE